MNELVKKYLDDLPEDRRAVVSTVRELVLKNLPAGYEETFAHGMLAYVIPLSRFPTTYNKEPLTYIALAAQKNYYSLYLMGTYSRSEGEAELRAAFEHAGKKLDMGKSCLRFKRLEDLPQDVISAEVASIPPERFIEFYRQSRGVTG
jgi:hypothetical protein